MTTEGQLEFTDDRTEALHALDGIVDGRGWCNLTLAVSTDDVRVLTPSVFSLRTQQGAPVASYVTTAPREGVRRPGTLGVLHTRGRLGKERIATLLGEVTFTVKQDHTQRGLLLEVPAETSSAVVLSVMCDLLDGLSEFVRSGPWGMDVFER